MNLQENINRIKQVMGIITENEMDRILDKISVSGMDSLTPQEKRILQGKEKEREEDPTGLIKDQRRYQVMFYITGPLSDFQNDVKEIKHTLTMGGIDCNVDYHISFPFSYYQVYFEHEFQGNKILFLLSDNGYTPVGEPTETGKEEIELKRKVIDSLTKQNADLVLKPNHEYTLPKYAEIHRIENIIQSLNIHPYSTMVDEDGTYFVAVGVTKFMINKLMVNLENHGYDVSRYNAE
jgi:hypothetical protein